MKSNMKKWAKPIGMLSAPFICVALWHGLFHSLGGLPIEEGPRNLLAGFTAGIVTYFALMFAWLES